MPDQPSEWGKLNKGRVYLPLALDVARALFSVGLGEHCACMFWYIAENSWGHVIHRKSGDVFPDPVGCPLNLSQLSEDWKVPRQRLSGAKKWLVDACMIEERDGLFWINKDADKWVNPTTGDPLLSPERLAYATAARDIKRKRNNESIMNGTPCTPERSTVHVVDASHERSTVRNVHALNGTPFTLDASHERSTVQGDHLIEPAPVPAPVGLNTKDKSNPIQETPPAPQGGSLDEEEFALTGEDAAPPKRSRAARKARIEEPFVMPEWVPGDEWEAFVEMRRKLRKPPTDFAIRLIVKELDKLRCLGQAPDAVLQQSIRNSWQDVFPLREGSGKPGSTPPAPVDHSSGYLLADRTNVHPKNRKPAT